MTEEPSTQTSNARLGHLETAIASLASQVSAFVKDSHEHRERIERDQALLWQAVKEQGKTFTDAVSRISDARALSWPVIVVTIGMILGLISAFAFVAEKIADARLKQQEIRMDYMEKISELKHSNHWTNP